MLLSVPQGLSGAAAVIFYVFLAGGALTIVEATGAIGNTLDAVVGKFGHRPNLVLLLVSSLVTPAGGSLLAMLALADVPYGRWLRFVAIPVVLLGLLAAAAMAVGARIGLQ